MLANGLVSVRNKLYYEDFLIQMKDSADSALSANIYLFKANTRKLEQVLTLVDLFEKAIAENVRKAGTEA